MLLPTHALVGAVIGKNINDPWLIVTLAIIFHFVMDAFRHGEYLYADSEKNTTKSAAWKIVLEISIAVFVVAVFLYTRNFDPQTRQNILLGSFFSVLPDLVTFFYWLNKKIAGFANPILKKYYSFHSWVHRYPRNAPERAWNLRNATNDIIISVIAIILLLI